MAQITVSVNGRPLKEWIEEEVVAEISKFYTAEVKGFRKSCKESAVSARDIRLAKELAAYTQQQKGACNVQ